MELLVAARPRSPQLPPMRLGPIDPRHVGRREGHYLARDEAFRTNLESLAATGALDGAFIIDDTGHALPNAGLAASLGFAVSLDLRGIPDDRTSGSWLRLNDQYQSYRHELRAARPPLPRGSYFGIDVHRLTPLDTSALADVRRGARIVLLDERRYTGAPQPGHDAHTGAGAADSALAAWLRRQLERGATLDVYGIDVY